VRGSRDTEKTRHNKRGKRDKLRHSLGSMAQWKNAELFWDFHDKAPQPKNSCPKTEGNEFLIA
jgi:hypothetical protein